MDVAGRIWMFPAGFSRCKMRILFAFLLQAVIRPREFGWSCLPLFRAISPGNHFFNLRAMLQFFSPIVFPLFFKVLPRTVKGLCASVAAIRKSTRTPHIYFCLQPFCQNCFSFFSIFSLCHQITPCRASPPVSLPWMADPAFSSFSTTSALLFSFLASPSAFCWGGI